MSGAPCWKEFADLPSPAYEDKGICLGTYSRKYRRSHGFKHQACIWLWTEIHFQKVMPSPSSLYDHRDSVWNGKQEFIGVLNSLYARRKKRLGEQQLLNLLNFPIYEQMEVASRGPCPQHGPYAVCLALAACAPTEKQLGNSDHCSQCCGQTVSKGGSCSSLQGTRETHPSPSYSARTDCVNYRGEEKWLPPPCQDRIQTN